MEFVDTLTATDVEAVVCAIEEDVRQVHPDIVLLLIEPQSAAGFERAHARRLRG